MTRPDARGAVPILIVDDNASKRLALRAVLSRLGHTIVEADSGHGALRCVMAQDFAVILLDVKMPDMDGFETAALIRTRRQSEMTPIIFITAYATDEIPAKARYVEGAVDFIHAPVDPDELRAKVAVFANLFIRADVLAAQSREVQESADRLRVLTDGAPVGIFQTDARKRFVYTNPRWTSLTGIPSEQALGRTWDGTLAAPGHAVRIDKLPCEAGEDAESCERFEITDDDGTRIVLATSERILDPDGETAGWIGTLADVTAASREREADAARREAEDRYRHIVETTMEGVWVVDSANHTTFANEAMAGMLETTVADMQGRSLFEFVDGERSKDAEAGGSLLRGMGESEQFEMTLRTRRGAERHALLSTNPLLDEAGNYEGALAMVRDVTERVEQAALRDVLEEQLRQSQRLESIGQLAGGIAHDFNNLLLVIRGFGELALGRLGRHDDDAAEYVRDILEAADRATLLTKQLLAFGRRQVLQPEVIDLRDVVTPMERLLRPLLGEDVELVIVSPDASVLVVADPTQIEQVILNLAVNARDAIPNGGRVTIEVSATDEPTPEAVLAVTDNGSGMDAETIARIFEPFFSTKGDAGTGLGLATVHGIVNQSGGRIGLESRVGEGSTFSIFLPLSTGTVALPAPPVVKSGGGADTILVVEDDPMVRTLVTKILDKLGYRVLTASGGQAALELTDAWPAEIDLILTDLVMPGLGGRETAKRIRGRFPTARVLYMSGYTDDIVIRGGAFEPGTAFVQKPFGSDELARSVRDALDLDLELAS